MPAKKPSPAKKSSVWDAAIAVSETIARADAIVAAPAEPSVPPDRWGYIRGQAEAMAPGMLGALLWVESRCVAAGLHPMDPQWLWHFEQFYTSGKMVDVGRFGLRAAKSDSCCRAIAAEVLLGERRLEPGLVGVCPVISRSISEANDRTDTLIQILSACGLRNLSGTRSQDEGGFVRSGGGNGARTIALADSQGHSVEFRIYPASIAGAVGFTGIAGFCDEVDLWGKDDAANPARRVFEVLYTRYTTQPEAKLHVMSASYFPKSAHAEMIAKGDTPLQRVARLGAAGAAKDSEDRMRLAAALGSNDQRLLKPADPESTDIPCWVSNPVAPIEDCYKKAEGNIDRMLSLFGGRGGGGGKGGGSFIGGADANRQLNEKHSGSKVDPWSTSKLWPNLPAYDPRSSRSRGGGGGERGGCVL